MPTQVPSGSALAVRRQAGSAARRRKFSPGPRMLGAVKGYAHGGMVRGERTAEELKREVIEPEERRAAAEDAMKKHAGKGSMQRLRRMQQESMELEREVEHEDEMVGAPEGSHLRRRPMMKRI